MPMLKQMSARIVHIDEGKCFAVFDNEVYNGSFYAVKASESCLITRYDVRILAPAVLQERHVESLCITCFCEDWYKGFSHRGGCLCLDKNIAVCLNRDEIVEHKLCAGEVYSLTTIIYLPEFFDQEALAAVGDFHKISNMVSNLDRGLLAFHLFGLFEDLDMERASRPSGSLYYQSKAMQALVHVLDMVGELNRLRRKGIEGEDFRLVRQVIEAIEENLAKTPTIEELSQRVYVGHTHLCETFKRTTGLTIGQYARKRKIEFSKVLLRNPEIPIKEIARRMGYGSSESFSASFRKVTGMSPSSYRNTTTL